MPILGDGFSTYASRAVSVAFPADVATSATVARNSKAMPPSQVGFFKVFFSHVGADSKWLCIPIPSGSALVAQTILSVPAEESSSKSKDAGNN
jgi:hypothetical protein